LKKAVAIDPAEATIWGIDCFRLAALGRLPDALTRIQRCLELDPLSVSTIDVLAMCFNWMRQYDRAIAESLRVLELDPNFPLAYVELGIAYVAKGMYEAATAEMHKALKSGHMHPRVKGMLGYAYASAGNRPEALKVLVELRAIAPAPFGVAFPIARIHAALKENDQAFEWLRKACDERDSAVIWIKVDPTLDNLRSDPRFAQVLNHMGLPA
jgi:tetratricopeptide (TPR) repeat protein